MTNINISNQLDDDDIDFLGGTVIEMLVTGTIKLEGSTRTKRKALNQMCDAVRLGLVKGTMDPKLVDVLVGLYKVWLKAVNLPVELQPQAVQLEGKLMLLQGKQVH